MPPQIATICYTAAIAGLFWLVHEKTVRTSVALWLPTVWLLIVGSRSVANWLQIGPRAGIDGSEGSPVDAAVLSLLLGGGVAILLSRRERVGGLLKSNWPLVCYFLYCAISVIWSDYPVPSTKRWFRGLGDLAMVLVILTDRNPTAAIRRVLTRVGFVLLPVSILFIKYYPAMGRFYIPWSGAPMWTGVTLHKSSLGQICLLYGLAALWCCLVAYRNGNSDGAGRKGRLLAQGTILTMAIYLLWLSDSKTSLACFILAGPVMIAVGLTRLARQPVVLHTVIPVLLLAPFLVLFVGVGQETTLQAMNRNPTLTGRTETWEAMLRRVDSPWFGAGYESFLMGPRREEITRELGVFYSPHNGYLETYLNLGRVGVALIVLILAAGYRNVTRLCRRNPELGALALAYFIVAVVYNLTEGGFKMMSSVWVTLLLVSLVKAQIGRRAKVRLPGTHVDPFRSPYHSLSQPVAR